MIFLNLMKIDQVETGLISIKISDLALRIFLKKLESGQIAAYMLHLQHDEIQNFRYFEIPFFQMPPKC